MMHIRICGLASLVAERVKSPLAIWEDLGSIPGLGRSPARQPPPVFLLGESPWTEKPGDLQPVGLQRVGTRLNN